RCQARCACGWNPSTRTAAGRSSATSTSTTRGWLPGSWRWPAATYPLTRTQPANWRRLSPTVSVKWRHSSTRISARRPTTPARSRSLFRPSRRQTPALLAQLESSSQALDPALADPADHDDRRWLDSFSVDRFPEGPKGGFRDPLAVDGGRLDNRHRLLAGASLSDKLSGDRPGVFAGHDQHECAGQPSDRLPAHERLLVAWWHVPGDDRDVVHPAAVSQRYPSQSWRRCRARDPGDDGYRHPGCRAGFGLFQSATEDEGIPALQAHHLLALLSGLDEHLVGFLLGHLLAIGDLGDVHELRPALGCLLGQPEGPQVVGEDDVGALDGTLARDGDQPLTAGATAH